LPARQVIIGSHYLTIANHEKRIEALEGE